MNATMALDENIKRLLKELGDAINESISESPEVNDRIQQIRDEGYNLYVVLDATIGLNREDEEGSSSDDEPGGEPRQVETTEVQFRINVNDLAFLRSVGIDPTRKVRTARRLEGRSNSSSDSDGNGDS